MPLIMGVLAACLVLSLVVWRRAKRSGDQSRIENRLRAIDELSAEPEADLRAAMLRQPFAQRVFAPMFVRLGGRLKAVAPRVMLETTRQRLAAAGIDTTAERWLGYCVITGSIGLLLGLSLVAAENGLLLLVLLAVIGAYMPYFVLSQRTSERKRLVLQSLPDVLDLLTVSVRAGLGFDSALQRVIERFRGPLAEELAIVLHQIRMGVPRKDALRAMAERTGVRELHGFVGTIIQAEQLGVSISNVLQNQAEAVREQRRQRAHEKAMQASVKMLFPIVLFIFPSLFIVLLGPVVIKVVTGGLGF